MSVKSQYFEFPFIAGIQTKIDRKLVRSPELLDLENAGAGTPVTPVFTETSRRRRLRGVVRWPHKLVRDLESGREELYDLSADPGERRDLGPAEPERVRELGALLDDWIAANRPDRELRRLELSDEEREHLKALGYL